ncbi:MAG: hydantoinase/oxoprolinase family protein, partial [Pseudohongiellaceae bacterium]
MLEQALSKRLPCLSISRSSSVFPVYKEFERGVVTWLNAALGPVIYRYLAGLGEKLGRAKLQVMQSSGETLSGDMAAERAVNLLLSGPAGGLKAVQFLGKEVGQEKLISFDMGGTSTDVALIDKNIETTTEGRIGPYPIGVPMLDMHTIGAGGGSIAFIDEGGLLRVGPQSSGAEPGPACYGKGGLEATVTDAHLVLGRLSDKSDLAGGIKLDKNLANREISKLSTRLGLTIEEAANGIIQIANEHMIKAIRLISVNRGYDPKDFVLFSFGGAGGLHVCEIAEGMQMEKAIVPAYGGVLSALGMLVADRGRQFV